MRLRFWTKRTDYNEGWDKPIRQGCQADRGGWLLQVRKDGKLMRHVRASELDKNGWPKEPLSYEDEEF